MTAGTLPDAHLGTNESENMGASLAAEVLGEALSAGDLAGTATTVGSWAATVTGREAFVLYDTYGFPPELTAEIAREQGLEMDSDGFEQEMESQREQSRSSQGFTGSMEILTAYEGLGVGSTNFVGYQELEREALVAAILVDNAATGFAREGQQVEVVLDDTPFYAESGGQVGDQGTDSRPQRPGPGSGHP